MSGQTHNRWSGRLAFALAATGSAVGLGNVWKFPYIAGEHGGGAFVLVYLCCIALIGVPIMIAEVLVGRLGRRSPVNAYAALASDHGGSDRWAWAGLMALAAGFLVLSFYGVIAGWAVAYLFKAGSGAFTGATDTAIGEMFADLVGSPATLVGFSLAVYAVSAWIVGRGVNKGIESAVKWMMPVMFALLVFLAVFNGINGDFAAAARFLFVPSMAALSPDAFLVALGHAFFTLSLGAGIMMMYGAYLQRDISIGKAVGMVAVADTVVALLAGLAIFPVVFASDLPPESGPGLVFQTLPLVFGQMEQGWLAGLLFFALLVIAALASTISILEAVVVYLCERFDIGRWSSVGWSTTAVFALSLLTTFSFNIGNAWKVMGRNPFELIDYAASNIALPLGGLAVSLFCGWVLPPAKMAAALRTTTDGVFFRGWLAVTRFVAPVLIILVFIDAVDLI